MAGKDIYPERALAHVAGYCVANDVTARGYHQRDNVPADAFAYDWFAAQNARVTGVRRTTVRSG
jgi:2-keto-4-pentenoate hydratase/2-oxohepta-3-ene-1,7-dioic acid hydratase in catechol pathway